MFAYERVYSGPSKWIKALCPGGLQLRFTTNIKGDSSCNPPIRQMCAQ
jgi:hypothetical protein